jgi:hypothetical protein
MNLFLLKGLIKNSILQNFAGKTRNVDTPLSVLLLRDHPTFDRSSALLGRIAPLFTSAFERTFSIAVFYFFSVEFEILNQLVITYFLVGLGFFLSILQLF